MGFVKIVISYYRMFRKKITSQNLLLDLICNKIKLWKTLWQLQDNSSSAIFGSFITKPSSKVLEKIWTSAKFNTAWLRFFGYTEGRKFPCWKFTSGVSAKKIRKFRENLACRIQENNIVLCSWFWTSPQNLNCASWINKNEAHCRLVWSLREKTWKP